MASQRKCGRLESVDCGERAWKELLGSTFWVGLLIQQQQQQPSNDELSERLYIGRSLFGNR